MTFVNWVALLSAIILVALGGVLVFQFGYAKGRRDAEKQVKPIQPGKILPPPERPS